MKKNSGIQETEKKKEYEREKKSRGKRKAEKS